MNKKLNQLDIKLNKKQLSALKKVSSFVQFVKEAKDFNPKLIPTDNDWKHVHEILELLDYKIKYLTPYAKVRVFNRLPAHVVVLMIIVGLLNFRVKLDDDEMLSLIDLKKKIEGKIQP